MKPETVEPTATDEPTKRPTLETVRQIGASVTPGIALVATASPTTTVMRTETAESTATASPTATATKTETLIPTATDEPTKRPTLETVRQIRASVTPVIELPATASPTAAIVKRTETAESTDCHGRPTKTKQ